MALSHQAWYAGTGHGLFSVERNPDGHFAARLLGFDDAGMFRAPVVVDSQDSKRLYVGTTRAGIFRSDDAGETWREINQGLIYKDVWALIQHAQSGTLYAGTSPAGIFRSDDRGDTWRACESLWQLPSTRQWHGPVPPHFSRLKDLTLDQASAEVFAAIEGGWLLRSRDGGSTWRQIDAGVPMDAHSIRFVPGVGGALVVGTGEGMFRSTDGGETWVEAMAGLDGKSYTPAPLVTRGSRPGTIFSAIAATGPGGWQRPEGGDSAFCRSQDGGQSWQLLNAGLPAPLVAIPRAIAVDPTNPGGYLTGMTDGSLWETDDDGQFFRQVLSGLPAIMALTPLTV
jgi:photosystem II stability/assembly factor-like uncharacterized protein